MPLAPAARRLETRCSWTSSILYGRRSCSFGRVMADQDPRREPSDAQLDATIEGARTMVEANRDALTSDQDPVRQRGGGGGFQGAGGTAQGGSNSAAGTDHSTDPAAETGGPRGAGTSVSRTSGGPVDQGGGPGGGGTGQIIQ